MDGEAGSRATVLCVDDDTLQLSSLIRILARRGYRVVPCERAEQALGELPFAKPDLAIVDIMLPGMGGLDLAERLRRWSKGRLPVVLLTALATDEAFFEGRERGACCFLTKPCDPDRLLDVVDYLVGDLDEKAREAVRARIQESVREQ